MSEVAEDEGTAVVDEFCLEDVSVVGLRFLELVFCF